MLVGSPMITMKHETLVGTLVLASAGCGLRLRSIYSYLASWRIFVEGGRPEKLVVNYDQFMVGDRKNDEMSCHRANC